MATKSTCKTLDKVGPDEEIFTIRAQDMTAPYIVAGWICANIYTAPEDKLREALDCAIRMRKWKIKKHAD